MKKEEIFTLMQNNPTMHLATLDGNQPRVRAMFLYSADESGIIFHTGRMKELSNQINANPRVEICFNDQESYTQVRVSGTLEEIHDETFKDEICAHPSRAFLKPWRESGPLENFYETFRVFALKRGEAQVWTMATNFAPKMIVSL